MMDGKINRNKAQDSTRLHSSIRPSLCAPVNIVPLLPLSDFLFFRVSLFFWEPSTFSFDFLIFFLDLGAHKK
jgi:hypothetical protein